ncbi:MAG: hypothetical protein AB7H88_16245 [Vicinamibacterales bacterium]
MPILTPRRATVHALAAALAATASVAVTPRPAPAQAPLFADDFERGLDGWLLSAPDVTTTADSGDPAHGRILVLTPRDVAQYALIRGSGAWGPYRIEGDVLFPTSEDNYLGFIYHYREADGRRDLGSIYIKGNDSYVRVNPRRDWNPARQMYDEYRVDLTGADAIVTGTWQRFAAEVSGHTCHFYVGDMSRPKVTFDLYEGDTGMAGFKPRVVGGPVWLDNVRAVPIARLTWSGPRMPAGASPMPGRFVTDWRALGPLAATAPALERRARPGDGGAAGGEAVPWVPFGTDGRGAVVTGRLTSFLGPSTVAYFLTTADTPAGGRLAFSTIDDLAIWVDGVFQGYVSRGRTAWFDAGLNPDHPPTASVSLPPGRHEVLVRVRGGQYASGGFFAWLVRTP